MANSTYDVRFSTVPVARRSGGRININESPQKLIDSEKRDNPELVRNLHSAAYNSNEGTQELRSVINAYPHVHPGTKDQPAVHFMIAPYSDKFYTLKEIDMGTLNNMSKSALAFLEISPENSMVLTHETDHEMVASDKKTHKSWKQIHWHMKTMSPSMLQDALLNDSKNIKAYGEKLVQDFKKAVNDNSIGITGEVNNIRTYGYDVAFTIPFPKDAIQLSYTLKNIDSWLRKEHDIVAKEYEKLVEEDEFMHMPIYSIGMRRTKIGLLEIGLMPHFNSPNMNILVKSGQGPNKEYSGVTLEPFGNSLLRDPAPNSDEENARIRENDRIRIEASKLSIKKMLEHLDSAVRLEPHQA